VVLTSAGTAHLHGGSLDEALAFFKRAIRLSPGHTFVPMTGIAHVQMCLGHYEECLDCAARSLAENPNFDVTHWMLIAGNAHLGRLDAAKRALFRVCPRDTR